MADNMDENIKKAKIYADSLDAIQKKIEKQGETFSFIAEEMGVAFAGFHKQVEKTNAQLREEEKLLNQTKNQTRSLQKSAGDVAAEMLGISGIISKAADEQAIFSKMVMNTDFSSYEDMSQVQERINKLNSQTIELNKEEKEELTKLQGLRNQFFDEKREANEEFEKAIQKEIDDNEALRDVLKNQGVDLENQEDILRAINKLKSEGKSWTDAIAVSDKVTAEQRGIASNWSDKIVDSQREEARMAEITNNKYTDRTTLFEKLQGFAEKNASIIRKGLWSGMKQYDQAISDAGKNFGFVNMKSMETSVNMAQLGQSAARFNVDMKDAIGMMGDLGDELATIDQNYLANSVDHFMAIEKATGISSKEITTIAGEMMRAGQSAEDVEQFMEGSNKVAKMFGVNTKKVLQGVSRNIDKMRQMGFTGGEESLTRMVATAERLRMNVDEIFDVAAKARNIEGAMNMAADLQLAGGSFANIDPMSLLSAARKGPEELQKILTQMGDDIGSFNEDGEFKFDPVDVDRLQIVADATGQSLDSIQKMIQKNAEDAKKMDLLPSLEFGEVLGPDGKPMDQEALEAMMADSINMDGTIKEGSLLDEGGIDSLSELTGDQATMLMQKKIDDQKSLDEQAEANQSFQDSITAFKDAIMNMFIVFEPFIKALTDFAQMLNSNPILKFVGAAIVGFVAFGPKLLKGFSAMRDGARTISDSFKGMKEGKGVFGKIKGAFSGSQEDKLKGADSKDDTPGKSGGGLQSLSEGLKAMGGKGVLKGIGNTALAGPALLLMLPAMPTLLLMAGIGAMGKLVEMGFSSVARGISAMGNAKGLLKGALAMLIIGAAMIPFAFALSMMASVEWSAIGMMVVGIVALAGVTALIGFIAPLILMGSLALAAASVGLLLFGAAVLVFAQGAAAMQGMDFSWLGSLGWNLLVAAPGLLLGGLALLAAVPGLILGSIGLMQFAVVAQMISTMDWGSFAAMGDALLAVVPGLLGFSLAGLMFANPITLLGMIMMMGTLSGLAMIMTPLSTALLAGADGLDRFASGLEKLQEAANNLDFERLEALKDLSMGMAVAGAGTGALGDAIDKIAEAIGKLSGGGGGGGGGTQKIEVNLKLNGRDLQSIIIDDTEIVT
jgi:hypothetical protein